MRETLQPVISTPDPKLLCIVVDRSEKMAPIWSAVRRSIRAEIANAKAEGHVCISITLVDASVVELMKLSKEVRGIPSNVQFSTGCAIMDGLASSVEAAVDFTRRNPKYGNNVELLVYTKGVDTASTRIVSVEKMAKVIRAASGIGYNFRVIDPSPTKRTHRIAGRPRRKREKKPCLIKRLLMKLKSNSWGMPE